MLGINVHIFVCVMFSGNGHIECGQEVENTVYNSTQLRGDGFRTGTVDVIREVNTNTGDTLNSMHQSVFYGDRERYYLNSPSEDIYFQGNDQRHTPFSSLTEVTFHNSGKKFVASSKKFYYVHQSILYAGTTNGHSSAVISDIHFQKLRPSTESLALIEQCFTHKTRPITIAAVIAGRKKSDSLAKSFVKQLPKAASEKVSNILDEPTWHQQLVHQIHNTLLLLIKNCV